MKRMNYFDAYKKLLIYVLRKRNRNEVITDEDVVAVMRNTDNIEQVEVYINGKMEECLWHKAKGKVYAILMLRTGQIIPEEQIEMNLLLDDGREIPWQHVEPFLAEAEKENQML